MTYRYARLHTDRAVWQYHSTDGSWQYSVQFGHFPNSAEAVEHITSRGHHVEAT